jgi:hypothetical protein
MNINQRSSNQLKALVISVLAAVLASPSSALTVDGPQVIFNFEPNPNTTVIDSVDPFMFEAAGGFFSDDFVNETGKLFTDFHFEWEPPISGTPTCSGGSLFTECSADGDSADFYIGTGTGIADGAGFSISVSGFPDGTKFTAYPTVVPLPASVFMLVTGLAGLFGFRLRASRQARLPLTEDRGDRVSFLGHHADA